MKNLINFLIQYSVVFLFLFLEILSFTLIVKNQEYQKSVFFSSSNSLVSRMYELNNSVIEFFKLRTTNESLSTENTTLKNQIIDLQNKIHTLQPQVKDSIRFDIPPEMEYKLIPAKVINSTTNKIQNFITINKGFKDGIKVDMGVISDEGVVGIVKTVSKHFAVVIPVLNPKIQINSKFKRSNYTGFLHWEGGDSRFANLMDIARHVEIKKGDTLITSGVTSTFPEGVPVGIISDFTINESDSYYSIDVKLAVNFRTLSYVKVINYINYHEQKAVENAATKEQ